MSTQQYPKSPPHVQLTGVNHKYPFAFDVLETFSMSSGTVSYNSVESNGKVKKKREKAYHVLQDDRDVALKTRIVQLLSKEVPKKVEIGEHALHVINRRRRKKDNTLHRWKVDVQQPERVVHQEEKKDPQDLTSILIEDAFSTILSRKNPRGMSLNIRMSMKYNPIPMRTLEFEGNRDVRQSEGKSETVISDVELVEAALVEQKLEDQHQQRLKNLFATTTSKTTTAPSLHSNGEIKKRIINTSHIKLVNNLKK